MPPSSPSTPPSARLASSPSSTSPFLSSILKRRRLVLTSSTSSPLWAVANLVAFLFVLVEVRTHFVLSTVLRLPHSSLTSLVLYSLLVLFFVNFALDLWNHLFPLFGKEDITLNERQLRLMHLTPSDPGFKLSSKRATPLHPNPFNPPLEGSFILPSNASLNNTNWSVSPGDASSRNVSLNSSSWIFQDSQNQTSPSSPNQRRNHFNSSFSGPITDERGLAEYLREYDQWEKTQPSPERQPQSPLNTTAPSFWKPDGGNGSAIQDYSPLLSKLSYQMCSAMPSKNPEGGKASSSQGSGGLRREDICYRCGIDPMELVSWMENIRLWISQTVLVRLVKQVADTNRQLEKLGMKEVLIGEAGLEKVKKASQLPNLLKSLPGLRKLIPFLELSPNQAYLVKRVRELAEGGAMSGFKWDGGGSEWKGDKQLPTDSELVMHCVACYLDARLPPVKGVIDGKVFSSLYYFRLPEKPEQLKLRVPCAIVQTASKPPHYVLQIGEVKIELNSGRNNLFHTVLLFLHHIKTKEGGILGRVNFGRSGINILWVIDQ